MSRFHTHCALLDSTRLGSLIAINLEKYIFKLEKSFNRIQERICVLIFFILFIYIHTHTHIYTCKKFMFIISALV